MSIIPDAEFELLPPENNGFSIAMFGSTRSGKSTALGVILQRYFKDHIGVLMTNSPQAPVYKNIKEVAQSPTFIPRIVRDMAEINKQTNNKYNFLACLDDVVTNVKYDKEILKLLCIYRNSNVSTIICAQAVTLMSPAGRTNINNVLMFKLNTDSEIEKVIKSYLNSWFPKGMTMQDKILWYRLNTENHHFIVLDTLNNRVFRTKIKL